MLLFLFHSHVVDFHVFPIISACKGNLCFGKQAENTIGGAGGPDQIRRAIKTQNNRNSKYEKNHSHPKGIPKGSNVSAAAPRFSTGCTSIRACSESAIAFSQRQMHDIECLATKLSNELKTMKEIAEERLQREAYPATSLRYNANEVRQYSFFFTYVCCCTLLLCKYA